VTIEVHGLEVLSDLASVRFAIVVALLDEVEDNEVETCHTALNRGIRKPPSLSPWSLTPISLVLLFNYCSQQSTSPA
jgi:hypothetical protein